MCIICVQYELGKLTKREALNALPEMISTEAIDMMHAYEIFDLMQNNEEED